MNAFFVTVCGLVILLGFEIRYRSTIYEISLLKIEINKLGEEILKLKAEMKLKQNISEEHGPST
jgi:FtsZ-binding cell division protein ZapB